MRTVMTPHIDQSSACPRGLPRLRDLPPAPSCKEGEKGLGFTGGRKREMFPGSKAARAESQRDTGNCHMSRPEPGHVPGTYPRPLPARKGRRGWDSLGDGSVRCSRAAKLPGLSPKGTREIVICQGLNRDMSREPTPGPFLQGRGEGVGIHWRAET